MIIQTSIDKGHDLSYLCWTYSYFFSIFQGRQIATCADVQNSFASSRALLNPDKPVIKLSNANFPKTLMMRVNHA